MNDENKNIMCPGCRGEGRWEAECCNGSGGCSCRGEPIDMGKCNVCGGSGYVAEGEFDKNANVDTIRGLHFLGTGPNHSHGLWPNRGGY